MQTSPFTHRRCFVIERMIVEFAQAQETHTLSKWPKKCCGFCFALEN